MKLVLLFFCGILILIFIFILVLVFSSIRLNIKELYISNVHGNLRKTKLEKRFKIYLELYLFDFIKIARFRITKKRMQKITIKQDKETIKEETKLIKKAHPISLLKKLKPKIKSFYLESAIGIDDVCITSYLIAIIASIIRTSSKKYKS